MAKVRSLSEGKPNCDYQNDKSKKEAVQLYQMAAEQGHADVQFNLALCYQNGSGVAKDEKEAVRWYRMAAKQGHAKSQFNLATCYQNGTGVAKAEKEAVRLYRIVAKQGDVDALNSLALCYQNGIGVNKNEKEAIRLYRMAAEQGHAKAQFNLAVCYDGTDFGKNAKEAVRLYRMAAKQGHIEAQNSLAVCYDNGTGVGRNKKAAVRWYRMAAEKGHVDAQFNLALCYDDGSGVAKDEKEAFRLYRMAAEKGHPDAQFNLAACYQNGTGVDKDEKEAVRLYRIAAEQGDVDAMNNLAVCYQNGTGVNKNEKEAVRWYRMAAENASAQFNLAVCYEDGTGVTKDVKEAIRLYRMAAEQGHAKAQFNLAICYENGTGVHKDEKESVRLYRIAAEQRHPSAQNSLAVCYQNGIGVNKNEKAAVRWYQLASEQGHVDAQFNLALCYDDGSGVAKDEKEAFRLYRMAAEKGHPDAQFNLAACYRYGTGVDKDEKEAVRLYRIAAEQGDVDAQNSLAVCYDHGIGVTKDEKEAVRWYRMAVEQEHTDAQFNLALCYRYGTGVTKDEKEAFNYYQIAAEQGHADAQFNLAVCYDDGIGVGRDEKRAFHLYQMAAEQGHVDAQVSVVKLLKFRRWKQDVDKSFNLDLLRPGLADYDGQRDGLGSGVHGVVFRTTYLGWAFAVKTFHLQDKLIWEREVELLKSLKHVNVATFLWCGETVVQNKAVFYLILKLGERSLSQLLESKARKDEELPWHIRLSIALGTAKGLQYLHNHRPFPICHRDLKGANISLNSDYTPFIIDFGLSKQYTKPVQEIITEEVSLNFEHIYHSTKEIGTPGYLAPEMASGRCGSSGPASDIFSLSMVFYELLTRTKPPPESYKRRPSIPTVEENPAVIGCPVKYVELMQDCWSQLPEDRPPIDKIVVRLEEIVKAVDQERETLPLTRNLETIWLPHVADQLVTDHSNVYGNLVNLKIQMYSVEGNFIQDLEIKEEHRSICISSSLLYILSTDSILVTRKGTFEIEQKISLPKYLQCGTASCLYVDGDTVFLTVKGKHQIFACRLEIKKLLQSGHLSEILKIGNENSGYGLGQFNNPIGLVTHEDNLYVCDSSNNRIQVIEKDTGLPLYQFYESDAGGADLLFNPEMIFYYNNLLYIRDFCSVQLYTLQGKWIQSIFPTHHQPPHSSNDISGSGFCVVEHRIFLSPRTQMYSTAHESNDC